MFVGFIWSGVGFYILKVFDICGIEKVIVEEVNLCYIFVKLLIIFSEDKVKVMLMCFKEELKNGEVEFVDLVKEYLEDLGLVFCGGELGWFDLGNYVFEFKEVLL